MAYRTMSNPSVIVNNEAIAVAGNSVSYVHGFGEYKQRVGSTGGDSVEFYISEDVTTKVAVVKFKLFPTKQNDDRIATWKILSKTASNAITLSEGDFVLDFTEMVMINDPEMMASADGEVEIEFHGRGIA